MTEIVDGLNKIISQYDAIFCDVWGVVHNGEEAFVDAVEALMNARLQSVPVYLVTNSPKTPAWVEKQLERMNVPTTSFDTVITAGLATQYSLFSSKYKRFYFIGSKDDEVVYKDLPEGMKLGMERTDDYKTADVVLCAGPDYGIKNSAEDYEVELRQLASRKLPMYCANPDVIVDHGARRIWCGGAIAMAYEAMGGLVFQFGKPFPPIYQLARNELQNKLGRDVFASRILFIGDGIDTDLKGAMLEDLDALFVSGGLAAKETGTVDGHPVLSKLNIYLNDHQLDPRFTIGKLRW